MCRTLLELGVLQRVAGDEEAFVQSAGGEQADALYDVQRRALAGMLAAVRGPSTWAAEDAPATLDERLRALVDEHVADSEEGRRTALRHQLARRLLDDPVVYIDSLEPEARAYFVNQRGAMAARLCEATGLVAEQRAEGLALVDETGALTDVAMPAEGTEAHATLLVAEFLARRLAGSSGAARHGARTVAAAAPSRRQSSPSCARPRSATAATGASRRASPAPKPSWPRSRSSGWRSCSWSSASAGRVAPLPALARFALGDAEVRSRARQPRRRPQPRCSSLEPT